MACYTVATVTLDNSADNRAARKALNLPLDGPLSQRNADRVKTEAAVIKAMRIARQKAGRNARITRKGNQITVTVTR